MIPGAIPASPSADPSVDQDGTSNPDDVTSPNLSLPDLSETQPTPSAQDLQTSPRSIGDALDTAESGASSGSIASAAGTSEGTRSPARTEGTSEQVPTEPTDITVQPPNPIDLAPAQGDASRLLAGFVYDSTDVSPAEADVNLQAWLAETAENKSEIDSQQALITIDSNFKVCKDNPPTEGLVGIIVNPDGTTEQAKVLRSIGYDVLNRQAIDEIERANFEQPTVPTQYQVSVEVLYQSDGCVEELPEAIDDIDG